MTVAVTHTDRERRGSSIGIRLYQLAQNAVLQSYTISAPAFAVYAHTRATAPDTLVERVQHQTSRSKGCTRLGCIRTGGAL